MAGSVILVGCIDFLSFVLCVITLEMNLSYEAGVTVLRSVSIIIFFVIKTTKQVCLYFVDKKNGMRSHMSHSLFWTNFGMATIQTTFYTIRCM